MCTHHKITIPKLCNLRNFLRPSLSCLHSLQVSGFKPGEGTYVTGNMSTELWIGSKENMTLLSCRIILCDQVACGVTRRICRLHHLTVVLPLQTHQYTCTEHVLLFYLSATKLRYLLVDVAEHRLYVTVSVQRILR
jgi:hypothetical protein